MARMYKKNGKYKFSYANLRKGRKKGKKKSRKKDVWINVRDLKYKR